MLLNHTLELLRNKTINGLSIDNLYIYIKIKSKYKLLKYYRQFGFEDFNEDNIFYKNEICF